jgi:hypothetical protein
MTRCMMAGCLVFVLGASASADLMITDSGAGDRVMLFSEVDGSLIDVNWITDIGQPFVFTTPKEAKVVGNEIWVSDQVADAIHRFDFDRNFLGSITAHFNAGVLLDNLRGFGIHGSNVYLTIDPSNNANSGVVIYDLTGTPTGYFPGVPAGASLFDAAPFGKELLISNSTTDDIERYSPAGAFLGTFQTDLDFPQQVDALPDGTIIAMATIGAAGNEGVYHWNPDGSLIRYIDTEGLKVAFGEHVPHAAWPLEDGNYLISSSTGVYKYDVAGNSFSEILGDVDGQYINPIDLAPAPCPADVDDSGAVDVDDLVAVILGWGDCPKPPASCDADIDDSGAVDVDDLVAVILGWGDCP